MKGHEIDLLDLVLDKRRIKKKRIFMRLLDSKVNTDLTEH
jgi:hypothetical protein